MIIITHLMLQVSLQLHSDLRSADDLGSQMHRPSCQECQSCARKWQDGPIRFCQRWSRYLFTEGLCAPSLAWRMCTTLDLMWTQMLARSSFKVRPLRMASPISILLAPTAWMFQLGPIGSVKSSFVCRVRRFKLRSTDRWRAEQLLMLLVGFIFDLETPDTQRPPGRKATEEYWSRGAEWRERVFLRCRPSPTRKDRQLSWREWW